VGDSLFLPEKRTDIIEIIAKGRGSIIDNIIPI
jgi:repressor of nif and glnA expression